MKLSFGGALFGHILEYRQTYLLTCIASFGGMAFGFDTGVIGGVLTMQSFRTSFNVSPNDSSLQGNIVSVLQAGCFFGAASSFFISDRFGRRSALLISAVIFIIGSVLQTVSGINTTSLSLLYVGRAIGGFGVGLMSSVVPAYIGENANKEVRGRCIGAMQLFNVTGIMISYFINYGVERNIAGDGSKKWRIPFALQMMPGVLLLLIATQNESPRWYVEKDRIEDARRALSRVRGKPQDSAEIGQELEEIIEDFRGRDKMSLWQQMKAACATKSDFYRTSFAVILMFWQQWTGTNSINYYSPQIFKAVGLGSNDASLFATGIYGVVKVALTALGLFFITEQVGRKYALIIGAAGQAFSMFYIGIYQAVSPVKSGQGLDGAGTFAIVCIYLFVTFYSFGWGPIPFILSAECSPNHLRSLIMALALMTQWLCNFIIAKITPIMLANITYGTFLLFGATCALMGLWAIFFVPETKQVPLESLHLLFEGDIMKGALKDCVPRYSRARQLRMHSNVVPEDVMGKSVVEQRETV